MNTIIIYTPRGRAAFDARPIFRALERHARGVERPDVFDLPPEAWMDIDDTSGGSGAPAQAGCV